MKKGVVLAWLTLLFLGIAGLFWQSEWVFALPTPVPIHYHQVVPGTHIDLPRQALALAAPAPGSLVTATAVTATAPKPLFLHFFNPDCPCSRFNMPHFKTLVKQYGHDVNFAIVLMTDKKYTAAQIREKFDLPYPVPVITDTTLAVSCGVYSTPQAVILDQHQNLFYRGNYNRSRYCSDEKSSYAKIALQGLLNNNTSQTFSPLALQAYGCQLPTCNK